MARDSRGEFKARDRSFRQRSIETREILQRILIVCEGEKTEPNYFRAFRTPSAVIKVEGTGANTVSLVKWAIELRDQANYDQTWCVFDRDSFSPQNFNAAIQIAAANGIRVAYSNEAFELWYLLHFHYYNTGISREDYRRNLSQLLGRRYEKNDPDLYDLLFEFQDRAMKNAEHLLRQYAPQRPSEDNPSTTVHLLVAELRRYSS